jgi:hypothetical protein
MALLGVIKGFSGLPQDYREAIQTISDSLFINTSYSFKKAVDQTIQYANSLISQNGGSVTDQGLKIKIQPSQSLPLEVAFPRLVFDHYVSVFDNNGWEFKGNWGNFKEHNQGIDRAKVTAKSGDEARLKFKGTGISIVGNWMKDGGKAEIFIDGELKRIVDCYFDYANQSHLDMDIYHITNLTMGEHVVRIVVKGEKRPEASGANVYLSKAVVFKTANKISDNYKFSFQK